MRRDRRKIPGLAALLAAGLLVGGCVNAPAPEPLPTTSPEMPNQVAGVTIPDGQIDQAVQRLDGLADSLMRSSHIPGLAVAVVHDGKVVYRKGFGVRTVGSDANVGPETVFQLASVSKSLAATVVAKQVATGAVQWDTPVRELMPTFALNDPYVTEKVTVGDLFAHRSGLPDHAGDLLEDLGYDRARVLERLRQLPLDPFRDSYAYTNFGLTAAAVAVADAAGTDWESLSDKEIYQPLGMRSTSSRYSDFRARADRADGHVLVDGTYRVADPPRQPDAQSPAGGVSSSVDDLTEWMTMVLADGAVDGRPFLAPDALQPAVSPQAVSAPPKTFDSRAGFYGYGFNVGVSPAGRVVLGNPAPAQPLSSYAGGYANPYYGPATVTAEGGSLTLSLGPKGMRFPLRHWDGDTFVFTPSGENATSGSVSRATFAGNTLTLEYFDADGLGRFTRP
ncbi:serine hydrolase [Nocardia xishanensis]